MIEETTVNVKMLMNLAMKYQIFHDTKYNKNTLKNYISNIFKLFILLLFNIFFY